MPMSIEVKMKMKMEKSPPDKRHIGMTIRRDWYDRVEKLQRERDEPWSSYWRQAIRDRMVSDGLLKEADAA